MNNEVFTGMSAKIERMYNALKSYEVNSNELNEKIYYELKEIRSELKRSNIILEKIYNRMM